MLCSTTKESVLKQFCQRRQLPRRLGFRSKDLLEQLVEHPHQGVVVLGSEHFCDKPPTLLQELRGKLERTESEFSCKIKGQPMSEMSTFASTTRETANVIDRLHCLHLERMRPESSSDQHLVHRHEETRQPSKSGAPF